MGKVEDSCKTIMKAQQTALDWNFAMASPASIIIQFHL
jgi:hypothetical protein